jgi:hypothetical protein
MAPKINFGNPRIRRCPHSVAQACNLSYLENKDWEDSHLRLDTMTKSSQDPISTSGWAWWYMPIILATYGSINSKIPAQAGWA